MEKLSKIHEDLSKDKSENNCCASDEKINFKHSDDRFGNIMGSSF